MVTSMANKYTAHTYITNTHKRCSLCGETKLHQEFHKDSKNIYGKGLAYYCKTCANSKSRQHHNKRVNIDKEYKQKKKDSYIKSTYNISLEEYNKKLAAQAGCAICGVSLEKEAHLDHCHTTNKIRDFLCGNCNRGLGSFHDDINKMKNAIEYIKKHKDSLDVLKEGRCL